MNKSVTQRESHIGAAVLKAATYINNTDHKTYLRATLKYLVEAPTNPISVEFVARVRMHFKRSQSPQSPRDPLAPLAEY